MANNQRIDLIKQPHYEALKKFLTLLQTFELIWRNVAVGPFGQQEQINSIPKGKY